ncbi:MAG: FKBP-type peptidyl-prolyl cis-trans isomerase [Bacteroidales bacterium]|nr:FKBP-type peptidyl-prolyl cis-trans isomerase [Bacteroidales bacterium]
MKKLFFSSLIAAAALVGISSCCNGSAPRVSLNNDQDSLGYAYGVLFGTQYSNFSDTGIIIPDVSMDADNFLSGFISAFKRDSNNIKIKVTDADKFVRDFQMKLQKQREEKMQQEIAENKKKGEAFMAENAKKDGVKTLESGLQIEVLTEGKGKQPKADDDVTVSYKGTLVDGTVFDQGDSVQFNLNRVVKGFSEGLQNLKEGGKAILTMPSDLAYGDRAPGHTIPAGSTLQFEVELIKVGK